ncbi:MAG: hypothetical protein OJF55_000760 [Rhodanobacteraceae bacterium]|nr:MAG: hypothetical protein OJF55_000760 [Rhodanobacteraceae bacterium]
MPPRKLRQRGFPLKHRRQTNLGLSPMRPCNYHGRPAQAGLLTTNPGEVAEWSTILPGAKSDSRKAGSER